MKKVSQKNKNNNILKQCAVFEELYDFYMQIPQD